MTTHDPIASLVAITMRCEVAMGPTRFAETLALAIFLLSFLAWSAYQDDVDV